MSVASSFPYPESAGTCTYIAHAQEAALRRVPARHIDLALDPVRQCVAVANRHTLGALVQRRPLDISQQYRDIDNGGQWLKKTPMVARALNSPASRRFHLESVFALCATSEAAKQCPVRQLGSEAQACHYGERLVQERLY